MYFLFAFSPDLFFVVFLLRIATLSHVPSFCWLVLLTVSLLFARFLGSRLQFLSTFPYSLPCSDLLFLCFFSLLFVGELFILNRSCFFQENICLALVLGQCETNIFLKNQEASTKERVFQRSCLFVCLPPVCLSVWLSRHDFLAPRIHFLLRGKSCLRDLESEEDERKSKQVRKV